MVLFLTLGYLALRLYSTTNISRRKKNGYRYKTIGRPLVKLQLVVVWGRPYSCSFSISILFM